MGKQTCPCGTIISDVTDPSGNNGWLVSDYDRNTKKIMERGRYVWQCLACGKIGVDVDGNILWFTPEHNKIIDLFDY